ncbi:hypothetical protein [Micromonospora sp. 4G55]|uniref:hypothetical protein n=1 Tax=Micromonospora sp. 4G55 TaxID=2806102 RepID=UPI001A583FC0|nr:hypothetical protein [Micromonospora sp. 4G55]MBM0256411.1 hypothetical protein [Micromonospora sp. 4G55]
MKRSRKTSISAAALSVLMALFAAVVFPGTASASMNPDGGNDRYYMTVVFREIRFWNLNDCDPACTSTANMYGYMQAYGDRQQARVLTSNGWPVKYGSHPISGYQDTYFARTRTVGDYNKNHNFAVDVNGYNSDQSKCDPLKPSECFTFPGCRENYHDYPWPESTAAESCSGVWSDYVKVPAWKGYEFVVEAGFSDFDEQTWSDVLCSPKKTHVIDDAHLGTSSHQMWNTGPDGQGCTVLYDLTLVDDPTS